MARRFTITHPDGTTSTRTSARAEYAFAVVLAETAEARVAEAEQNARRWERDAEKYREALEAGRFATLSRADFERFLGDAEIRAAHWREVAEVALGTPVAYSVLRWSTRRDLAEKAAREFAVYAQHGSTVDVVEVD